MLSGALLHEREEAASELRLPDGAAIASWARSGDLTPPRAVTTQQTSSPGAESTPPSAATAQADAEPGARLHPAGARSTDTFELPPELERVEGESQESSEWNIVGPRRRARRIKRSFPAGAHPADAQEFALSCLLPVASYFVAPLVRISQSLLPRAYVRSSARLAPRMLLFFCASPREGSLAGSNAPVLI